MWYSTTTIIFNNDNTLHTNLANLNLKKNNNKHVLKLNIININ
jgi:hypothetical protein